MNNGLRFYCFLISFFFVDCYCLAQTADVLKIYKAYQNVSTVNILNQLEQDYSIKFFYRPEWFKQDTITISFGDEPIATCLEKLLTPISLTPQFLDDSNIVIVPETDFEAIMGRDTSKLEQQDDAKTVGDPKEKGKYSKVTIKGKVFDGKNGEAFVGAVVMVENTQIVSVTNISGEYSLQLAPGKYTLVSSNVGYEKDKQKINLVSNGVFNIELFEKSVNLSEVYIYAKRADRNVRSTQMSIVELDSKGIKQMPSLTGEKDIIKSFTMMPGVKSVGEFGSGINVRGGGEDQNLYLVENAPLFNTSHVFGLISVINPDIVNSVTLYKGHIPAGFGERVSSVMNIQVKNGNGNHWQLKGGIGLFNSRLMVEGPIYKDIVTFKLGGRTSYSDWLLRNMNDYYLMNSSASFYDINGLMNIKLKKATITLFGYNSDDKFRYATDMSYQYNNKLGSISWSHFISSRTTSNFTTSFSQYNVAKDDIQPGSKQSRIKSQINYLSGKYNISIKGAGDNTFDVGAQVIKYQIKPGDQSPLNSESLIPFKNLASEQGFESALYVNELYELNRHFTINTGMRFSGYFFTGPGTVMSYGTGLPVSQVTSTGSKDYKNGTIISSYYGMEPRLSLKFQVDSQQSVKVSYNRNKQYISLISYTSVPTPEDIWKLSDPFEKPIIANQYAAGYYRNFLGNSIETSVEVYYKKLTNLIEYKNDAQLAMNQHVETELINAFGKNYGIELMIKKNKGKVDGWISYTYSRSLKKTAGIYPEEIINNNSYYPSSYDKPHDISIMCTYHFNRRLRIGGNFSLATGRSVTLPEYQYNSGNEVLIYYSDRNKYRLPDYHRFDVSISMDENLKLKKSWKGSWTLSVLNVYGQKNIYSVFYKKQNPTMANGFKNYSLYKLIIIGRLLPTLTYNFIF